MSGRGGVSWGRRLARLAEGERAFAIGDVARRLLSLTAPVEEPLARRLVASAMGLSWDRVPARIGPDSLPTLLHGPRAGSPLERTDFVIVDLETTGLSARQASILEIGAVRVAALRRVESFHTLCDPGQPIPGRITRLTGIDAGTLEGAPALAVAVQRFRRWLSSFPGAPFVAHNASFDQRFVEQALDRFGLPPLEGPILCTRKLARRLLPDLGRFGLDVLCAHFGISNHARHRALGDAEATARALIEMLDLARTRLGLRTLGDLLELQEREPQGRRAKPRPAAPAKPR